MYIRIAGVFNFEWWVTGCVHNTSVCIKQFMQISEFQFCIFVSPKAQVKPTQPRTSAFIYVWVASLRIVLKIVLYYVPTTVDNATKC